jgi:hypothetical protein
MASGSVRRFNERAVGSCLLPARQFEQKQDNKRTRAEALVEAIKAGSPVGGMSKA